MACGPNVRPTSMTSGACGPAVVLVGLDRLDLVAGVGVGVELVDRDPVLRGEGLECLAVVAPVVRQGDGRQATLLLGRSDQGGQRVAGGAGWWARQPMRPAATPRLCDGAGLGAASEQAPTTTATIIDRGPSPAEERAHRPSRHVSRGRHPPSEMRRRPAGTRRPSTSSSQSSWSANRPSPGHPGLPDWLVARRSSSCAASSSRSCRC